MLETWDQSANYRPPSLAEFVENTSSLVLYEWQKLLCEILQRCATESGLRLLVHAPPQAGKPVWVESKVLMGDGSYKRLGDIVIGDEVVTDKGRARPVVAVFEQGPLPCVRLETRCGREAFAALDHPFLTADGWVNAGDLEAGHVLACTPSPECGGKSTRSDDEFEMAGYFIGDGCCKWIDKPGGCCHAGITTGDDLQKRRICEVSDRLGWQYREQTKSGTSAVDLHFKAGARDWLRETGLAGKGSFDKIVPEWVWGGTARQIGIFLGAYFSCDGNVCPKGKGRNGTDRSDCTIEIYSVSHELLIGVQSLLLRIGVQSRVAPKKGKYKDEQHNSWRLSLYSSEEVAKFRDRVPVAGKKADALAAIPMHRQYFHEGLLGDTVVLTEDAGTRECRCLSVAEDHTFTVQDLVVHNSLIVSKRFPAWLLGLDNTRRIGVACFNERHAGIQTEYLRDMMLSDEYKAMFPDPDTQVKGGRRAKKAAWSTIARSMQDDGHDSMTALGMLSGTVGKGFDDLIIDDPYASPEEADSVAINEKTDRFWTQSMEPRINRDTNVVMMFHRYHDNDIVARRLKEGGWQYVRFPMLADENTDGSDPTGREIGQVLSPMRDLEWCLAMQAADEQRWLSQFQGVPGRPAGTLIKAEWFDNRYHVAPRFEKYVRGWDVAFTKGGGDETVGTLLGIDFDGTIYVIDVITEQLQGPEVTDLIMSVALTDPPGTVCAVERALASLSLCQEIERRVATKNVAFVPVDVPKTMSKYTRMQTWLSRAKRLMVRLPQDGTHNSHWVADWIFEATRYNDRKNDADNRLDSFTTAFEAVFSDYNQKAEEAPLMAIGSHQYYEELDKKLAEGQTSDGEWWQH